MSSLVNCRPASFGCRRSWCVGCCIRWGIRCRPRRSRTRGRRIPIVATCDGEAGLLDNIGSIVGVKQKTLAVRKFSKCGRPDEVYAYHHLDAASIVEAAGEVLARTALESLRVSPQMLARFAGKPRTSVDWRELWPAPDERAH